jgi:hypothetical protein
MITLFRALPMLAQIGAVLGLLALLYGSYKLWEHRIYRSGWDAAIAAVAAQDQEAVDAANKAGARIAECRASGGVWRASTGQCEGR